jgi:hypothetical protein
LIPQNIHWFQKLVSQVSTFFQICAARDTAVGGYWCRDTAVLDTAVEEVLQKGILLKRILELKSLEEYRKRGRK